VSHLGGLAKDNTGYDLAGLLCGSEGTLGVVTAARLRLVPAVDDAVTALVGFPSVAAAMAAVAGLRRAGVTLEAAELVLADGLALAAGHLGAPPPVTAPAVLLLEWSARAVDLDAVLGLLGDPGEGVAAVAEGGDRRAALWRHREAHTEAVNALGPPHKLDVTLPLAGVAPFVDDVVRLVEEVAGGSRCVLWGHAGDGNLHVNVVGPAPDDDTVDDAVLRLVAARGGSISAEHGIGSAKRAWLHLVRTPAELAAFRAVKEALDPAGVLNPGVLLPPA
jgi:FAD/FMN-containing dehydrogenase